MTNSGDASSPDRPFPTGSGSEPDRVVVDVRPSMAFLGGHLPGALHLPPDAPVEPLAAWVLPRDRELVLLGPEHPRTDRLRRELSEGGYSILPDLLLTSTLAQRARSGVRMEIVPQLTRDEAEDLQGVGEVRLVDVDEEDDAAGGAAHGAGQPLQAPPPRQAIRSPLSDLRRGWRDLPLDLPLVVCSVNGARTAAAAGLLQHLGVKEVLALAGGTNRGVR